MADESARQVVIERQFLAMVVQRWHPRYGRILRETKADYLAVRAYQWFVPLVRRYLDDHDAIPPWEWVDTRLVHDFEDADARDEARQSLWLLYSMAITWGDQAVEDFREHVAWRSFSTGFEAAQHGYRRTKSMRVALDAAARSWNAAMTVLQDTEVHDVLDDYRYAKIDWERNRDNPGLKKRFWIGIEALDAVMRLEEGTVTCVLGAFKSGKSIVLNHFALAALVHGYDVAQIVYENTYELTRDRHFSRLLEAPYAELTAGTAQFGVSAIMKDNKVQRPEFTPDDWKRNDAFVTELCERSNARLKVIEAVPRTTTVDDVEAQLDVLRAEEGFDPAVTIWDYANLIGVPAERRSKEERINQETVIWDLQRYAKAQTTGGLRKKIVITAAQAKYEAVNKQRLDKGDFGKSVGIPQAIDNGLILTRSSQDHLDRKLRFNLDVTRQSAASDDIVCDCDLTSMCIATDTRGWFRAKAEDLFMRQVR